MATWEELTAKQAHRLVDKFGRWFVWTPDGGTATNVKGILDHNYLDETGGIGIQTHSATMLVDAADVPNIDTGDAITDGGTNYLISALEPDGEGTITLVLMRV